MAIYTLTDAQRAKLIPTRDLWMKYGVCSDRIKPGPIRKGLALTYKNHGLTPPKTIVWVRSPLEGTIAAAMIDALKVSDDLPNQVINTIGKALARQGVKTKKDITEHYRAMLQNGLEPPPERIASPEEQATAAWSRAQKAVIPRVTAHVLHARHPLRQPSKSAIDPAILDAVYAEVTKKVFDPLWKRITRQKLDEQLSACCYGQQDANWLCFFSFFRVEVGAPEVKNVEGLEIMSQNSGWWWPFRNIVVVSDRPLWIDHDEQNRMHSENRMAIKYPDGFGFHMWHGTHIPSRIIEQADEITAQEIINESNMETRRIMMEKCGMERLLAAAEKFQEDDYGSLWRLRLRDDEPVVMAKVINSSPEPDGTFRDYVLRVPPNMRTCHQAIAWSFGYEKASQYHPDIQT